MINIFLVVIFVILALQLSLLLVLAWRIYGVYQQFKSFISPAAEGQPSPLGQAFGQVSDTIAAKIKTAILGVLSGAARADKAATSEVAETALEATGNPILGLLGSFPKLRKLAMSHPELLQMAMTKMKGNGQASGESAGSKWTGNFGG